MNYMMNICHHKKITDRHNMYKDNILQWQQMGHYMKNDLQENQKREGRKEEGNRP